MEKLKKLSAKDLINTGIFTAIYFVVMFVFTAVTSFAPITYVLLPAFIAILCAPIYMLFITKVKTFGMIDMYPLYWTPSKEGIFMRYSHEYKLECIELYRQGIWPETPEGIKTSNFHQMVRYWVRIEEQNGPDALKHLGNNKVWTPEAKYELVAKVLAGQSYKSVAVSAGINNGMLYTWVRKYKELGYNGLVNEKKGRKSKNPDMKKKTIEPKPLTESEREELIRLRAEIAAMKAEIEVVKKRIALRQERWAAQLKAKKQQSSKRSEKKDTN